MPTLSDISVLFICTLVQNACFTLVSRARNGESLSFNALATVLSTVTWLVMLRQVVNHLDSWAMLATFVAGSVLGSVGMHWVSMRHVEGWFKS